MAIFNMKRSVDSIPTRPITTLFMLESLDGKISSGSNDSMDADKDFCRIKGVKEGLPQYYELEKDTDEFSLNTGRVMAKIGVNDWNTYRNKIDVLKFVIIDNKPHLTDKGIDNLCHWVGKLLIVTTNKNHPAFGLLEKYDNLEIIYQQQLDLKKLLSELKKNHGCDRITIQSGGNMNGRFVREKLLDYVNIVIAPILVGGSDVSTLVDGVSITSDKDLDKLLVLELQECKRLEGSFVQLKYKVRK